MDGGSQNSLFYWDISPHSIYQDGDIWIVPFLLMAMAVVLWRWWTSRKTKVKFDPERDFDASASNDEML